MREYIHETMYRDDGCSLHSACLTCPLPVCRYDSHRAEARMARDGRQEQARALRDRGQSPPEIAQALGVSRRTVYRMLA